MPPTPSIPTFLLPRGLPSTRTLRSFSTTRTALKKKSNITNNNDARHRVLSQPDKFRPPSHPPAPRPPVLAQQRADQLPGSTDVSRGARGTKEAPIPEHVSAGGDGDVQVFDESVDSYLDCDGVLTSCASFTFITNFKASSPFAHLLPPMSGLLSHPLDTISQAFSVYRMHVQHNSMRVREQRHRRIEDAEKRRQYRVAHGLEEPAEQGTGDNQSPVAEADVNANAVPATATAGSAEAKDGSPREFVDWEGNRRPVKKWLGIW
ncbi:hypothetical protein NUU61_008639 [Penicillium alfredii]|uniref:Uncharacterized protein n=1 Tax=Penicillium alfredii TaxID=1506179 RepID=A0A9W9JWH7_9EURO|nr:uncharacterized protein NUU61_008639 [Penicillium alfredii]KAJ5084060.1 hypothetical protein NUU61_008639 [Penicillium alfredii]